LALASKIIKIKKYNLYLIAAGGVSDSKSAYAKILCGAHLVQLYSSMTFDGPLIAENILKGLLQLMNRDKISSIKDIRGIVDNPEDAMKIANNGLKDCL
jgi:dihydroorotate dehydrogenase